MAVFDCFAAATPHMPPEPSITAMLSDRWRQTSEDATKLGVLCKNYLPLCHMWRLGVCQYTVTGGVQNRNAE